MDHCLEPFVKAIPGKRVFRPIIKNTANLTSTTLKDYLVKRTKAYSWNFKIFTGHQSTKNLKVLKSALRSNKTAQKLTFNYDSDWQQRNKKSAKSILKSFSHCIRGQTSINKISFLLNGCAIDSSITKIGTSYLRKDMKSLRSLKSLTLDCCNHPDITKNKAGLKALRLQDVSLDFNSGGITDKGIKNLAQELKRQTQLQKMNLKFYLQQITEAGFQSVGQSLNSKTHLQTLQLYFTGITDKGMLSLGKGLKELVNLKNLKLGFSNASEIRDRGLSNLGLGLAKLNLTEENFSLNSCANISDIGLLGLNGLVSLQSIFIRFSDCPNITDEGLHKLGFGLATLSSLQNMTLNFSKCGKLTGEGMQGLDKAFQKLSSLQSLDLLLFQCNKLTETGMHCLSECLKPLMSLKNLRLVLSDCTITERGMQYLNQSWTHLPLEKIDLQFYKNSLTDAMLEEFGKSLNQITSLTSVVVQYGEGQKVTKIGETRLFQTLVGHQCLKNIKIRR